jgi:hypothetical protein
VQSSTLTASSQSAASMKKMEAQFTSTLYYSKLGLSAWEQLQEEALERTGRDLPKTVIRIAKAGPVEYRPASLLQVTTEAALEEVVLQAKDCQNCMTEHFAKYSAGFSEIQSTSETAQVCSYCALYAIGGIFAGEDAKVNPQTWSALPKNQISLAEHDEVLIASPPREKFWQLAIDDAFSRDRIPGSVKDLAQKEGTAVNMLNCATEGTYPATCMKIYHTDAVQPGILLEVQSSSALTSRLSTMQKMIATMATFGKKMMMDIENAKRHHTDLSLKQELDQLDVQYHHGADAAERKARDQVELKKAARNMKIGDMAAAMFQTQQGQMFSETSALTNRLDALMPEGKQLREKEAEEAVEEEEKRLKVGPTGTRPVKTDTIPR